MNKEMSDDQQQFIEDTLKPHKDLEVKKNKAEKDVKVVKIKKNKIPGYKKASHWMVAFTSIPILLVAGFFILLMRAEQYLGGRETLDYLVEHNNGQEGEMISQVAKQAGQGWLPGFLTVYEYKIPIVTAIIAIFLIIVILFVLIDSKIHAKKEKEESLKETENKDDHEENHKNNVDEEENDDGELND